MFERMDKTWIRVVALAVLMAMTAPIAAKAAGYDGEVALSAADDDGQIALAAADDDGKIKESVHKALNPYEDVSISVDGGQVTLNGNVGSNGEKTEAIFKASSVSGVRGVRDELRVVSADDSRTVAEYVDDAAVTAKVKAELITVDGLESRHISVDTLDGVVMLTGSVKNADQSNVVEKKVNMVKGVKKVDNRLAIMR